MAEPKKRRFKKRWLLLSLIGVAWAGFGLLQHPAIRGRLHARIASAIEQQLGLEADIGPVHFEFPSGLVGQRFALKHKTEGLLVSATRVVIRPSLLALFSGRLELANIRVENAYVRLRIKDGRVANFGTPKKRRAGTRKAAKSSRLPVEELVVHQGRLLVDASPSFVGSLNHLNAVVRVSEGTRIGFNASVGSGRLEHARGKERVDSVRISGRASENELEIDELDLHTTLLMVRIEASRVGLPIDHGRYRGHVELSADLRRLAALPHSLTLPKISGKLRLSGDVEGLGSRFHAKGKVELDKGNLEGFGFGDLSLAVEATPDEVILLSGSEGHIVDGGGLVSLQGRVGLTGDMPVEVSANVEGLEFEKLMLQLGITKDCVVHWLLRGGFKIAGTLNPVSIAGPIWADHLRFATVIPAWHDPHAREVIGTPPGHVKGSVSITEKALRFENLVGKLPHSEVRASVHIGFDDKLGVEASSDALDLRDATGLMGMSIGGRGPFNLSVGGTYEDTTLTGHVGLKEFMLDDFRVGDLTSDARLEKDGLAARFTNAEIVKGESHYSIDDLLLDFSEAFSIDATARIHMLTSPDFYHTFGLENDPDFARYQGRARGTAKVRYTLGFPGDDEDGTLSADTELTVLDAKLRGISFKGGNLAGRFEWPHIGQRTRGIRIKLDELHLHKGRGTVHASGQVNLGGALDMTVVAEELAIKELDLIADEDLSLNGELNAVGRIRGTLWVPDAQLDTEIVNVTLGDRALGDLESYVHITSRDTAKALSSSASARGKSCSAGKKALASANWQSDDHPDDDLVIPPLAYVICGKGFDGRLALDVALGMSDELPLRGQVAVRDVPMSWLFPRKKKGEAPITGQLSGRMDVSDGVLDRPDSLVGSVVIDAFRLGQDDAWIEADGAERIRLTGRGAVIERARFKGRGSALAVTGSASLAQGLQTNLAGEVDLAALTSFLPGASRMRGQLVLDVKVTGNLPRPSVFGRATVRDGLLALGAFPRPIEKISASLAFSERELLLESLSGNVGGGSIAMRGSATLGEEELDRYELFLNARDISLEPYSGVELGFAADTRLAFTKAQDLPKLSGVVRVLRARYTRPFSLGISERFTGMAAAKRVYRETYDPELDHVALDLKVVEETPLRVSNNLLNAELSIEDSERPFRLVGTDQRWGVLGTLELTRGTLRFRNNEFIIDQGTVTFDDEHRIRPRLDVHARTELRRTADASGAKWLIAMHATGEADNLKLETSSDPALAQEDIALLLTAGLTRAEAERLNTGDLTTGAALEALATVTGVDREVKKALPVIDDFSVTSSYSARTNRTEPYVVVGKRLSDKVRATATTGLNTDSSFKTGVEWRFDDRTSVEAAYDNVQTTTSSQFGNVGVDLRWRLEFD